MFQIDKLFNKGLSNVFMYYFILFMTVGYNEKFSIKFAIALINYF